METHPSILWYLWWYMYYESYTWSTTVLVLCAEIFGSISETFHSIKGKLTWKADVSLAVLPNVPRASSLIPRVAMANTVPTWVQRPTRQVQRSHRGVHYLGKVGGLPIMKFSALNRELSNSSSHLTPTSKKNKPTQEAQVCISVMRLCMYHGRVPFPTLQRQVARWNGPGGPV